MTQSDAQTVRRISQELKGFLSLLPRGSALFLGASGGVDSMVLATLLARLRERGELPDIKTVFIVHVNHRLRGKESNDDARFVRAKAQKWGFEYLEHSIRWRAGEKKSQDMCRKKRYRFFKKCLANTALNFLVLAHHEDDQAETVLQRLVRGTGLVGLAAMRPRHGAVLRPLLGVSRAEIELVAKALGVKWREDKSNNELKYERNWLRHEVLPLLDSRRPGVGKRLAALASEAQEMFSSELQEQGETLLPLVLAQELTRQEIHTRFGLDRAHTERFFTFLQAGKSTRLSLPNREAWISAGWVWLGGAQLRGKVGADGRFTSVLGIWRMTPPNKLMVRSAGSSGKVKKMLVRAKIPAFLREAVPLAVAGEALVALVPASWGKKGEFQTAGVSWRFSPSELAQRIFTQGSSGRTDL